MRLCHVWGCRSHETCCLPDSRKPIQHLPWRSEIFLKDTFWLAYSSLYHSIQGLSTTDAKQQICLDINAWASGKVISFLCRGLNRSLSSDTATNIIPKLWTNSAEVKVWTLTQSALRKCEHGIIETFLQHTFCGSFIRRNPDEYSESCEWLFLRHFQYFSSCRAKMAR